MKLSKPPRAVVECGQVGMMHSSWIAAFATFVALAHCCLAVPAFAPTSPRPRRSHPVRRGGSLETPYAPMSPCQPRQANLPSNRREGTVIGRARRINATSAAASASASAAATAAAGGVGGGGIRHVTEVLRSASSNSATALHAVTERAISTPPIAYLVALLAAGFGAPVSEDALCIFAGTVLPRLGEQRSAARLRLLACLYLGVTLSDAVTFGIGRALRLGLFEPVRARFFKGLDDDGGEGGGGAAGDADGGGEVTAAGSSGLLENGERRASSPGETAEKPRRRRKRDVIRERVEKSGDYVGFVARLSVGMRGPLMLLAGFVGAVSLPRFFAGSLVGALVSLPAQLAIGYCMRDNPDALVGVLAGGSTFVFAGPVVVAVLSWLAVVSSRALGGAVSAVKGTQGGGEER